MKVTLNLTKDEVEWLNEVVHYGAEVTDFMVKQGQLTSKKDWRIIQYQLYEKLPFESKDS